MKLTITKKAGIEIIAALFIFLFVYTGLSKLQGQDLFRAAISDSPLIAGHAKLISILIPVTELITALLLVIPATRFPGFLISTILMTLFTGYISYMILFTPKLPCSCGGVLSAMSWQQHLVFNIFFTVLAGVGVFLSRRKK